MQKEHNHKCKIERGVGSLCGCVRQCVLVHLCKCVGIEDESLLKTRTFSFRRFAKRAERLVRLDERREVLLLESGEEEMFLLCQMFHLIRIGWLIDR